MRLCFTPQPPLHGPPSSGALTCTLQTEDHNERQGANYFYSIWSPGLCFPDESFKIYYMNIFSHPACSLTVKGVCVCVWGGEEVKGGGGLGTWLPSLIQQVPHLQALQPKLTEGIRTANQLHAEDASPHQQWLRLLFPCHPSATPPPFLS